MGEERHHAVAAVPCKAVQLRDLHQSHARRGDENDGREARKEHHGLCRMTPVAVRRHQYNHSGHKPARGIIDGLALVGGPYYRSELPEEERQQETTAFCGGAASSFAAHDYMHQNKCREGGCQRNEARHIGYVGKVGRDEQCGDENAHDADKVEKAIPTVGDSLGLLGTRASLPAIKLFLLHLFDD